MPLFILQISSVIASSIESLFSMGLSACILGKLGTQGDNAHSK